MYALWWLADRNNVGFKLCEPSTRHFDARLDPSKNSDFMTNRFRRLEAKQ
jgi:hypothetical protein